MEKKKKSAGERLEAFFAGKGFYIVLFMCVAVIGISAWVMLANSKRTIVDNEADMRADTRAEVYTAPTAPAASAPSATTPIAPVLPDESSAGLSTPDSDPAHGSVQDDGAEQNGAGSSVGETGPAEETAAWSEESISAPSSFIWPTEGEIEVPYSVSALIYNRTMSDWRTHSGIDIAGELGAVVMACAGGRIESIYTDDLYGVTIVIDHGGGLKSVYSNLAETPTVLAGDSIMPGEIIGAIGQTALAEAGEVTHLHFAMTLDGNPVNPADYLPMR